VGVEQLGYLTELRRPKPLPSLAELEEVWRRHFNKSAEQKRKVLACWRDFKKVLGVTSVRDITPEAAVAFRDAVYARGMSGKSQQNVFTRVRRMVSFARDRAISVEELSRVLQVLALLKPSENTVTLNPIPIDVADWKALYGAAEGDDRAMVLVMLNCAMYMAEAIRIKWDDVKGDCLVTRRLKTGKCVRVATLWPETTAALSAVRRKGEHVFYAYHGRPLGIKGAERRWRQLRQGAKRPQLLSSQLRDGAYSTAVEANVDQHVCQLLVGHRSGIGDHYVLRKPGMVRPACDAIRRHYFG
jgi:integrase